MSKKDYIAIAKILSRAWSITDVVNGMADYFAQENPRFDRAKFIRACRPAFAEMMQQRKDSCK